MSPIDETTTDTETTDTSVVAPSGRQTDTRLPTRQPTLTAGSAAVNDAAEPAPTQAPHNSRISSLERAVSWFDPTNLVCWLYVAMLGLGVVLAYTTLVRPGMNVSTAGVVFSIGFWGLFTIPWIAFIAHRELFSRLSRRTAVLGFLWGGFVATFVIAITAELPFMDMLAKFWGPEFLANWGAGITAGWIEEIAAGIGIVAVLFMLRQRLRSPFEMMVLGMFVGLGFQVVEDFQYMVHGLNMSFGQNVFTTIFQSFMGRVVLASWWSHQIFTGLFGAGLGYLMSRDSKRKPAVALGLMLSAILLHSFWDSPVLSNLGGEYASAFIKGFIMLGFFVWVYRIAANSERDWVVEVLTPEADRGLITSEDIDSLQPSYHRRKKAWRHLHHAHGAHAVELEKTYQSSLIELADELVDAQAAGEHDQTPELVALRAEVASERAARDEALVASK